VRAEATIRLVIGSQAMTISAGGCELRPGKPNVVGMVENNISTTQAPAVPGSWVIGVIAHKGNDQGTMLRRAHRAHAAAHRTRHHPYRRSGFTLYAFEADKGSLLAFLPGCRCWRVLRPRLTPSRPPSAGTTESRPEHGGNSTQRGLSRSTAPKTRRHEPNRTIAAERRIRRRRRGPGTIITSSPTRNGTASTGM
jgi:hypothetical protein